MRENNCFLWRSCGRKAGTQTGTGIEKSKAVVCHVIVFCVLLLLLWGMLIVSSLIPNESLRENMEKSALTYREKDAFSFENGRKWNGISDNYADTILLNISWNMGNGNPLFSSLDTWYYDGEELGESVGLYLSVTEEGVQPNVDYSRYWHGSAVFIRLLHLVTDVEGIKLIGLLAALLPALLTLGILAKYGHVDLAAAFLLSMGAVQIWNIRLSLEYQPAFIICFLLCPFYLWAERKRESLLTYLSVAGGVTIAFFDFLTTETVTIVFPLILVTAVRAAEGRLGSLKRNVRSFVLCGFGWIGAYAGTFTVKWAAVSLATGNNKFLAALSSAEERFGGSLQATGTDNPVLRIPMAVAANLTVLFGGEERVEPARIIMGILFIFLIMGSVLYLFYQKESNKDGIKLLLMLGMVVFLRYMVLNNHSYMHEFFTYRALISPVMAGLAGGILSVKSCPRFSALNVSEWRKK